MNQATDYFLYILNTIKDYSPKVLSAIVILIIGIFAIKFFKKIVETILVKRKVEPTLIKFLSDFGIWAFRITLFIVVISKLGIETSSFVAILGAMGLAIGLSLQGSLSNFSGGVLIILFKPFKLGDTIEVQGEVGKVLAIQIFSTKIVTTTNQIVYIPNGILSNGKIKNFSQKNTRKSELIIKLPTQKKIANVQPVLLEIIQENVLILQQSEKEIAITELTHENYTISIKFWVKNQDFSKVNAQIMEAIAQRIMD